MKFRVTMKDPDGVSEAVNDAVKESVNEMGLPPDEAAELIDMRVEKETEKLKRWFQWSEYLTIEVDTELMTATIVER